MPPLSSEEIFVEVKLNYARLNRYFRNYLVHLNTDCNIKKRGNSDIKTPMKLFLYTKWCTKYNLVEKEIKIKGTSLCCCKYATPHVPRPYMNHHPPHFMPFMTPQKSLETFN